MKKYTVTTAFNVVCYVTREIEAESDEDAKSTAHLLAIEPNGWTADYDTADQHRVVSIEDAEGNMIAEDEYVGPNEAPVSAWSEYMFEEEQAICDEIITRALAEGMFIRVWDMEEWATGWTLDRAEIQRETAATEITFYHFAEWDGGVNNFKRLGWAMLVHGNGVDVLSDMGAPNREMLERIEKLFEGVEEVAG